MITPQAIADKAARLYPRLVTAWLNDDLTDWFPRPLAVDLRLPKEMAAAIDAVAELRNASKQTIGHGYTVHWETRRSRTHGLNEFPVAITLDSLDDLLRLAGKQREFQSLQTAASKLRAIDQRLDGWLRQSGHWKRLLAVSADLDDLLQIVHYFQTHPRPDCYAREIPLAISGKCIEQNQAILAAWLDCVLPVAAIDLRYPRESFAARYGLRYPRPHYLLRILDGDLQRQLGLPFDELSLPLDSLGRLPVNDAQVMIVENKINLLTLPPLRRGLAIGGLGNAITLLASIPWLATSAVRYWGDLDAEGLRILGRLRLQLPHIQNFLMDQATLANHRELVITGNAQAIDSSPAGLTAAELALYEELVQHRWRLEQERIPQPFVVAALAATSNSVARLSESVNL